MKRRGSTDAPPPTGAPLTPESTEPAERQAASAEPKASPAAGLANQDLDVAILRFLRRAPNQAVDLTPLAKEVGSEPFKVQLAVEQLHRRRMVVAPFIEPGASGGAELTEKGLRWLIEFEGGKPSEVPVALKIATEHVRTSDEAARLPRAKVYGVKRPS